MSRRFAGFAALAMAVMLAFGLAAAIPAHAHAKGTTTMWVVAKEVSKSEDFKTTTTYSYTPQGLVKKMKTKEDGDGAYIETYAYDGQYRLKKSSAFNYKANSKGYVVSEKNSEQSNTLTYNSKGQLTKYSGTWASMKFAYDKKGRLASAKDYGDHPYTVKFTYDKKGSLSKQASGKEDVRKYKNTYKSGRLVKSVITATYRESATESFTDTSTYTYAYKKVKVPNNLVKMVKTQQQSIFNIYVPFASAHK